MNREIIKIDYDEVDITDTKNFEYEGELYLFIKSYPIPSDDGTNDFIPYSDTEEWAENEADYKSVEYWFDKREDDKKEVVEIDTKFGETFIVSNINIILNDNEDWPEHLIKGIDCETGHEIRIEEDGIKRIKQYTGDKVLYY